MCVGAAVPDLTYPFMANQGQTLLGGIAVSVPLTLLICVVLRWRAAAGVCANLPDLGPWRIHSYRALTVRRPAVITTVLSAVIGVSTHVILDSATHGDRLIAQSLGLDRVLFTIPWIHEVDIAQMFQWVGHLGGSVIGLWLLWVIGSRRLMEQWYGSAQVRSARRFVITTTERVVFWSITVLSTGISYMVFVTVDSRWVFKLMLGATVGALVAGSLTGVDNGGPGRPSIVRPPGSSMEHGAGRIRVKGRFSVSADRSAGTSGRRSSRRDDGYARASSESPTAAGGRTGRSG